MKHLALLALMLSLPVAAIELEGDKVVLTPMERFRMSQCAEQGGCYVVTRAGLDALMMQSIELTLAEVAKTRNQTCKRETI